MFTCYLPIWTIPLWLFQRRWVHSCL